MAALTFVSLCAGPLTDGVAARNLGLKAIHFYSEIDPHALKVIGEQFPDAIPLGDLTEIDPATLPKKIDILGLGFPCTDLSRAGGMAGLDGTRSRLFFHGWNIIKTAKPRFWFIENVASMPRRYREQVSGITGVNSVEVNTSWLLPQNRRRLIWSNFPIHQLSRPCGLTLRDILQTDAAETYYCKEHWQNYYCHLKPGQTWTSLPDGHPEKERLLQVQAESLWPKQTEQYNPLYGIDRHAPTLPAIGPRNGRKPIVIQDPWTKRYRYLTPVEFERLQGFPDDFSASVCDTARYRLTGNAISVPVVEHILRSAFLTSKP